MINYIEKGDGLHEAIKAAGHSLQQINGVWMSSNDDEVQAIIDSYDPIPDLQEKAKSRIIETANLAMKALEDEYPEFEKRTWPMQREDVINWRNSGYSAGAATPTIDAIALQRGQDRIEVLQRAEIKVNAYKDLSCKWAGERQRLDKLVEQSADINFLQSVTFTPPV